MKNVYDIRFEKGLYYILPLKADSVSGLPYDIVYGHTAIILYLYYTDTVENYYSYIDDIPSGIDIYIISSQQDVLWQVKRHRDETNGKCRGYLLKENAGRDVSALLVTSKEIVKRYTYVCFLHDKKAHSPEMEKDTQLWIENLWGNLIGSAHYINSILELFEKDEKLGVIAPPDPIGDNFYISLGYGWYGSFGITSKIADKLNLNSNLDINRPPITIGTALWFRYDALRKLFDADWKYADFDDSQLKDTNYISYGLERIFAYVAQDAGYNTATAMTVPYAEKHVNCQQYTTSLIFSEARLFFPIPTLSGIECYKRNSVKMIDYARRNKPFFLYGMGDMGRFCYNLLAQENLLPVGFIVSVRSAEIFFGELPVYSIDELKDNEHTAIIITVTHSKAQQEIIRALTDRKFDNYMVFWDMERVWK